jgi:cyclic 2,3-diphosphoglycerate synthetase
MRVVAVVDGEHYPPVTRWGIAVARERGLEVVCAVFVGGVEKLRSGALPELGLPVVAAGDDPERALAGAIADHAADGVLDLSDEPVVGYPERMRLIATALIAGVPYVGADFRLDPPVVGDRLAVPTVAVIGTGKRVGKTAFGGALARAAVAKGLRPVVVAMGRGGPAEPEVALAGTVGVEQLVERSRVGAHAASDYLEDAVTSGVTTVGARRVGGGLAGAPFASNVREAAELAVELGADVVVLEGSGAAVPPVPWDAAILVVASSTPPEHLGGYLGPYRLLLSDVVVLTMGDSPYAGPENPSVLRSLVQRFRGDARLVVTDFEPVPLGDVQGKAVFFATTAPEAVAARQVSSLRERHECRVVGWSSRLADRAGLVEDMEASEGFEVLLTELKAAAIDVAAERATAVGAAVVFVDNRPFAVDDGDDLPTVLGETIELARRRHAERRPQR